MTGQSRRPTIDAAPSPIHGQGVFARSPIPAGCFIGTYKGTPTDEDGTYVLWVQDDEGGQWRGVDGLNVLRYLNHSSTPNAEFDGLDLYALRPIQTDEEVTIDYGPWFQADE